MITLSRNFKLFFFTFCSLAEYDLPVVFVLFYALLSLRDLILALCALVRLKFMLIFFRDFKVVFNGFFLHELTSNFILFFMSGSSMYKIYVDFFRDFKVVFNGFFLHELTSNFILFFMSGSSMYKLFDGLVLFDRPGAWSWFRNSFGYVLQFKEFELFWVSVGFNYFYFHIKLLL